MADTFAKYFHLAVLVAFVAAFTYWRPKGAEPLAIGWSMSTVWSPDSHPPPRCKTRKFGAHLTGFLPALSGALIYGEQRVIRGAYRKGMK